MLDWFGNLWRNFAFTPLANLCGIPAISLPLATHEHGLPLGIQAIAKQANDGLLLQLAAQIERAIDGKWNAGREARRACDERLSGGDLNRHCERSEAIHAAASGEMDCFAALAMTENTSPPPAVVRRRGNCGLP